MKSSPVRFFLAILFFLSTHELALCAPEGAVETPQEPPLQVTSSAPSTPSPEERVDSANIQVLDSDYQAIFPPRYSTSPAPNTTQILLPAPTKEEWLSPRNVPAFFAILLSIVTFIYTVWSQSRSRKNSVNDEFWFRKVAYPLIIEPITNFFTATVSSLPSNNLNPQIIDEYCEEFQKNLEQHRNCLMMLVATFDAEHASRTYDALSAALDDFEDAIVPYCHEAREVCNNQSYEAKISREEAMRNTQLSLSQFIQPIRAWQHKN